MWAMLPTLKKEFFTMLMCYSVKDDKSGAFMGPFFVRNEAQAIRNVAMAMRDPQTMFNQFPGDYSLWKINHFDEETGEVVKSFEHVLNLIVLQQKQEEKTQ